MERPNLDAVNSAIRDCLERCNDSMMPLDTLASTIDSLRELSWDETDLRVVEHSVREIMAGVLAARYVAPFEVA